MAVLFVNTIYIVWKMYTFLIYEELLSKLAAAV